MKIEYTDVRPDWNNMSQYQKYRMNDSRMHIPLQCLLQLNALRNVLLLSHALSSVLVMLTSLCHVAVVIVAVSAVLTRSFP